MLYWIQTLLNSLVILAFVDCEREPVVIDTSDTSVTQDFTLQNLTTTNTAPINKKSTSYLKQLLVEWVCTRETVITIANDSKAKEVTLFLD